MAYSADTFTAGEVPTTAKWNKLWANDAAFNDGTGIGAGVITGSHLANGIVTFGKLAAGATRLGINTKTSTGSVLPTGSYTTYCTVTATSTGGAIEADFSALIFNGNSGAYRTAQVKVQCDGVDVTPVLDFGVSFVSSNNPPVFPAFKVSHTPAAGSHTWTLQVKSNTGSAVIMDQAYLRIAEVK